MAGIVQLMITDTILSFMFVWAGVMVRIIVHNVLGLSGNGHASEFFRCFFSVVNMFLFTFLSKITNGGAHNPVVVFISAINGRSLVSFVSNVGRIPFQVFGSIVGVRLILKIFPEIWRGPQLVINLHEGALTEGLLTFTQVLISLGVDRKIKGGFFRKTWINSILKLSLHILGSDLTGGCMNPAAVIGWAYALGLHLTSEHVIVYWFAPIESTLLAVWTFRFLVRDSTPKKKKKD